VRGTHAGRGARDDHRDHEDHDVLLGFVFAVVVAVIVVVVGLRAYVGPGAARRRA